jgi:hypothetical protein
MMLQEVEGGGEACNVEVTEQMKRKQREVSVLWRGHLLTRRQR